MLKNIENVWNNLFFCFVQFAVIKEITANGTAARPRFFFQTVLALVFPEKFSFNKIEFFWKWPQLVKIWQNF